MTCFIKFKIYPFYIFLSGYIFYWAQGQHIDIGVLQNLSENNQKWLQLNSIPEFARLLQYPPYVYHSSEYATDPLSLANIDTKNRFGNLSIDLAVDGKCSDDLIQILSNLKSQWALDMLDSDGKLSSGIFRGALIWPGHYSECLNVYAPLDENGHGDFHGQYCVSSWSLNFGKKFSNLPLSVGLCVPDSCSADHIKTALKNSSHILDMPFLKHLKSYLTLNSIVCKTGARSLDAPSIIYLTIVSVFVILTVFGSCITLFDYWKIAKTESGTLSRHIAETQNYGALLTSDSCINDTVDPENQISKQQTEAACEKEISSDKISPYNDLELRPVISHTQQPVPVLKRILLCFSIFTNGKKILDTKSVDGQMLSIHGIRFLSLTWVILGHTYISAVSIIGNKLDVLKDMDTFAFQMLLQAPFSVDSFFLLSGFLVTYLFLKQVSKKNGKISWLYYYIHRIWRLTPSYIIAVFFYMLIFKYLGSGPFWNDANCDASRSTWWKYFLYIHNFIPIHQMCLGWSWYLANDMQFYIISPLFLYPLWKWPVAGFTVIASFLIATWTTTGVMSYSYDLIPMFVGVTQTKDFAAYEKRMWDSFDLIYDKPYCRIAPYLIGVILGYILHRTADRKNFLKWWQQLIGWLIAAACSVSVVFGLYHVEMSRTEALFYNAFCRSAYSVGLAWLIYVCETGHGGFLTKLLSWKLWIPLSRLTYCAYLVHPMLIHGYYQSYQKAFHFTELVAVTNFMGFLLMSYGLAFAFSLVFESPFMNLEKLIIKRKTV